MPSVVLHTLAAALIAACAPGQISFTVGQTKFLGRQVPALAPTVHALAQRVTGLTGGPTTVGDTAWQLLALSATDSCVRSGPYKQQVRKLAEWLRACQANDGSFAPGRVRAARFEQLQGSFALLVAYLDGHWSPLRADGIESLSAVLDELEQSGAAAPSTQEAVLLAMIADLLRAIRGEQTADLRDRAAERAGQALAAVRIGRSRADDAAVHLGELLLGKVYPAELTVARCVPADLSADPWHTFVAAYAIKRLDHEVRREQWPAVRRLLDERGKDHLWPTAAEAEPFTNSAMLATAVSLIYVPPPAAKEPPRRQQQRGR